jgi:copper resistance protein D
VDLAIRWLHLLATITWVGGMVFIALVLVPVARGLVDPALRSRLVQDAGRRFARLAGSPWPCWSRPGSPISGSGPTSSGRRASRGRPGLVVLALALSVLHDFVLGPRAGRPGADPALRRRASWVARVNLLVVLAVVFLGLALRG